MTEPALQEAAQSMPSQPQAGLLRKGLTAVQGGDKKFNSLIRPISSDPAVAELL